MSDTTHLFVLKCKDGLRRNVNTLQNEQMENGTMFPFHVKEWILKNQFSINQFSINQGIYRNSILHCRTKNGKWKMEPHFHMWMNGNWKNQSNILHFPIKKYYQIHVLSHILFANAYKQNEKLEPQVPFCIWQNSPHKTAQLIQMKGLERG
jgi:hypothetical protein